MEPIESLLIIVLVVSAAIDLKKQRIPNLLTFPTMLVAMTYHLFTNGMEGFFFSLSGLLLGTALLIIPYLMGGMGGGDAKLMGAVGAVLGVKGVFYAFLLSALAGGIYAILLLIVKRSQFKGFLKIMFVKLQLFILTRKYTIDDRNPAEPRLCYGLAIAVGSISYLVLELSGYAFPI